VSTRLRSAANPGSCSCAVVCTMSRSIDTFRPMPQPGRPPRSSAPGQTSRRIQWLSLRQDSCAQTLVQRRSRQQVDPSPEELGELVRQVLDLPAEPPTRQQVIQNVQVTGRSRGSTGHRPEDHQSGDAVAGADRGQAPLIHEPFRHSHDSRLNPATARWRNALGTVHVGRGSGRELRGRAGPAANGTPEGEPRQPVAAGPFEITVCAWTLIGRLTGHHVQRLTATPDGRKVVPAESD